MLEAKIQEVPQVELSAFPTLNMVSICMKEKHEAKVEAGVLELARKQEKINFKVLTKLIEHIEKNL